jgi:hypothetical protein
VPKYLHTTREIVTMEIPWKYWKITGKTVKHWGTTKNIRKYIQNKLELSQIHKMSVLQLKYLGN